MNKENLQTIGIECREKDKYARLWKTEYAPSQCALYLADYIHKIVDLKKSLLEIGCGNGSVTRQLILKGHKCVGLDITLAGIRGDKSSFIEAPVWRMPFKDNQFDFTFSTDVMEHLPPELVEPAIKEICRITRYKTFHCIANFPDQRNGIELHLTQQPIEWWKTVFLLNNINFEFCFSKRLAVIIINRKDFLKEVKHGA